MKNTTRRVYIVLLLVVAFFGGLGFMLYTFITDGTTWVADRGNEHIYSEGSLTVAGTIYDISDKFGAFVAVDNKYSALIPAHELFRDVQIGQRIHARVKEVRPDGKLTLSIREKTHFQMDKDCSLIMKHLEALGGFLPFHDKSSPESIKREFQLSKAAFKRAIGRLYKNKAITISDDGIHIIR